MTNTNKQPAMCYPDPSLYSDWKAHAEAQGMKVSEFMIHMIESGRKPFSVDIKPDETNRELRKHRNELRQENKKLREKVSQLEDRIYSEEREDLEGYIEENPGTPFKNIVTHLENTVPTRAVAHIEELEGESIMRRNDKFYPKSHE